VTCLTSLICGPPWSSGIDGSQHMVTIGRRIASDGTVSYRVRVRILGEPLRTRTLKRKTDAIAWANAIESDIGRGTSAPTSADRAAR